MDKEELFKRALDKWGLNNQLEVAIEESAELIQAICKLRRWGETSQNVDHLIEEIADVRIMCDQLSTIYDNEKVEERIQFKLDRLEKMIED